MKKIARHKSITNPDNLRTTISRNALAPPQISNLSEAPIDFFAFLDDIAIGVLTLSLERKVVAMNQTLKILTGLDQQPIYGAACSHVLRCNVCLQNCPALSVFKKSNPQCLEGNLINRDRQLIPIRITSAPIKNIEGEIVGFLETVEDISLLRKLTETTGSPYRFDKIIGRSPEMEKIFRILPSLAQSDSSVLITGETGTGKDMVAEAIHKSSDRAKGPFVKVNCGALPETLLESELFGHQKGAFTGAVENKPGRFRLAHNGTLYLTEIGDLPLSLQVKLLTFLDDKEVFPLGSVKGFTADVRIIAATHRDLEKRVKEHRFRQDLLFRLNVIRLHLPPLRSRQGDIQLLLDHFLTSIPAQLGKEKLGLSPEALKLLIAYHYPGNVRELRNIVEYAINICTDQHIKPKHLPYYLNGDPAPPDVADIPETSPPGFTHPVANDKTSAAGRRNWSEIEKQMIIDALVAASGRKNKTAAALGWARSTLWRKMKKYGIQ